MRVPTLKRLFASKTLANATHVVQKIYMKVANFVFPCKTVHCPL